MRGLPDGPTPPAVLKSHAFAETLEAGQWGGAVVPLDKRPQAAWIQSWPPVSKAIRKRLPLPMAA